LDKDCGPTLIEALRWTALVKIDVDGAEARRSSGKRKGFCAIAVLICEVHCQQAADDVTRWLREKVHAFAWLEGPKQLPCHLLRSPRNGSSFPGTTSGKDS
jgi:hypothetical protein